MRIQLAAGFGLMVGVAFALATLPVRGQADEASGGAVYHDAAPNEGWQPPSGGPPDALAGGQSVIGTDDRIRIAATTVYPFSALTYIELFGAQGDVVALCSGVLIGPDAVLTAGHCLWDGANRRWNATRVRVVPGKNETLEPFGSEFATDWWVPAGFINSGGDESFDWGLIRLPDNALSTLASWMPVAVLNSGALASAHFTPAIAGYPVDKPAQTMWAHSRKAFNGIEPFRLLYDIDTSAGQSGSAIFSLDAGPTLGYVVGIHTSGYGGEGDNSGSRIDAELLADLLAGCAAMGGCRIDAVVPGAPTPTPTVTPVANRPFRARMPAVARD